jgi:ribosomal protein S18 acetylase RimI-like enzyme
MVVLREARPDEAAAIAAAHATAHFETYEPLFGAATRRLDPAPLELAWRRAFRDKAIVRLAEADGEIVGVGQLAGDTLSDLYLRASHRGRGLGTRMLAELLAVARGRGVETVRFNVHSANTPAIGFYEAKGARLVGRQLIRHPDGDWEDLVYEIAT